MKNQEVKDIVLEVFDAILKDAKESGRHEFNRTDVERVLRQFRAPVERASSLL